MNFKKFFNNMYAESTNNAANWKKLSDIIALIGNLKNILTPAEIIGSKSYPNPHESYDQFKKRIDEKRALHKKNAYELRTQHGLKTPKQAKDKIAMLEKERDKLWAACRPDLYELDENGGLKNKFDDTGKFLDKSNS